MLAFLLDVTKNRSVIQDIDSDLETLYKTLGCSTVEMPRYMIGDKEYTFICDEEALLQKKPIASAFNAESEPIIYGNIIVCAGETDAHGNLKGLKRADLLILENALATYKTKKDYRRHLAFYGLSY